MALGFPNLVSGIDLRTVAMYIEMTWVPVWIATYATAAPCGMFSTTHWGSDNEAPYVATTASMDIVRLIMWLMLVLMHDSYSHTNLMVMRTLAFISTVLALWTPTVALLGWTGSDECPDYDGTAADPVLNGCALTFWGNPQNYCPDVLTTWGCTVQHAANMPMCVRYGRAPLVASNAIQWFLRDAVPDVARATHMILLALALGEDPTQSTGQTTRPTTRPTTGQPTGQTPGQTPGQSTGPLPTGQSPGLPTTANQAHDEKDTLLFSEPIDDDVIRQSPRLRHRTDARRAPNLHF